MFIDGTFKLAPPLFAQVVVVIGKKLDLAVPVMYCLLQVSFFFIIDMLVIIQSMILKLYRFRGFKAKY